MDKTLLNILETFANSPDSVVFMTDAEGRYVYLEGQRLAQLGIDPKEWIGRSVFDFLEPYPDRRENVRQVFRGYSFYDTSRFGDNYFEDRLFPVFGPDGTVQGVAGIQVDVTARVRAEQNLQTNTDLLNNLFNSITDLGYILDRNFNILQVNAAVETMFPDLPLVGKICFEAVHHRDKPCEFCPVLETFETGKPTVREYFEESIGRVFELTSFPIFDRKNGTMIGVTEFARDITERKRIEETLRRNEALLNDLFEILDEGVYVIDTHYTIIRANKACTDMYPHLAPLVGKKCYDTTTYTTVCPDCAAACMFREGRAATRTFFEKSGEEEPGVWLELNAFPLYDRDIGEINGAICILRDVTPRVEMETRLDDYRLQIRTMAEKQMHELRLSEAKLRSILETSGAAISFADHRGRYTYVNSMFKEMLGYSVENLLDKPVTSILGPDEEHRREGEILVDQALRGEIDSFRGVYELATRSGRILWADISVSMVRGREPHETQLISVILDVTKQQELVARLNQAKNAAEEASREKSRFLATMSHEIRTPLNGVIGVSNLLMRTPLQPKQMEYAKLINVSGESLLALVNDILDFSKIEAGKIESEKSEFILHDLVESVLRILTTRAAEKNLELIATFDDRVPGPVTGDKARLRQVLINLIGNALKFTEEGGVRIHVNLEEIRKHGILLRFDVTDTGIGIPEEFHDRIFRHFSQIDSSSSRAYEGSGLGLAISKKLVEMMGGEIHFTSQAGRGSTFTFTVFLNCIALILKCMKADEYPCITEKRDYCKGNPPERCARSGRNVAFLQRVVELRGTKTLLVGNGRVEIPGLLDQFHTWGLDVDTVPGSSGALTPLKEAAGQDRPFRLLIVDFSPGDTGCESLIRAVQEDPRLAGTNIIGLTPLSEDWKPQPWPDPTKVRFISKPICGSVLLDSMVRLFFDAESADDGHKSGFILPEPASPPAGPIRVLVAEDNRINQIVVLEILRNAGMEATLVTNGREAVDMAAERTFDVILMDCQMPVMDGYTATERIRKNEAVAGATPIIALTANVTLEDEARCLAAGMNAYCSKPIDADTLIEKIRKWTAKTASPND